MPDRTSEVREPGAQTWSLIIGGSVVVLFGAVFVTAIAGFIVGLDLGAGVVVPALAAQIAFVFVAWRAVDPARAIRFSVATVLAVGIVLLGLGLIASRVDDTSIDGRHYQGESIHALVDGWNPIRDPALRLGPGDPEIFTNSYPKATWVLEATVMKVGGDFEASKLVGAALLLASALITFGALSEAGLRWYSALAGALVLALNPVVTFELGTHMVDGILASLLLATMVLTLSWLWRGTRAVTIVPLLLGVVLLVNTKFTGAVFAVLILGGILLVGGLVQRMGWRTLGARIGVLAAGALLGVVLFGFNPYVTNTLRHDGPLYPVLGPHSRDITRPFVVGSLRDQTSLERLVRSVSAKSQLTGHDPVFKVPLTFSSSEWSAFRGTGVRFGGFGPFFSGALLIAFAGAIAFGILAAAKRVRFGIPGRLLGVAAGITLLSVLVMPDSFIARFAPQLWFVPGLTLVALLLVRRRKEPGVPRVLAVIAWLGLAILLVNAFGVTASSVRWDVKDSNRQQAALTRLRAAPAGYDVEFGVWRTAEARRLRDADVRFSPVPQIACPQPLWLGIEGSLVPIVNPFAIKRPIQGAVLCRRA